MSGDSGDKRPPPPPPPLKPQHSNRQIEDKGSRPPERPRPPQPGPAEKK